MLKLGTFSSMNKKTKVQAGKRIIELKQSRGLLGRIALVCKSNCEFDLKEMIGTYELQVVPRGLMLSDGNLHPGNEGKSQLLQSLENLCKEKEATESVRSDESVESIVIIDAMAIVQKISPKPSWVKTVQDISKIFLDKVDFAARKSSEIHLVFDAYKYGSLQQNTRTKRRGDQAATAFRIEDKTNIHKISMTKIFVQ